MSKSNSSLAAQASQAAQDKLNKPLSQVLLMSMFAGAFIALAYVFYITVTTGAEPLGWGPARLLGGLCFSLGLILVTLCKADLFTSTVLTAQAWIQGQVNTQTLLKHWCWVLMGNALGALFMVSLVLMAGLGELDGGQWGQSALALASHKVHHSWLQAFSLGILCNLMVCLGVWMTYSSSDPLTKAAVLVLPVALFVSSGFEHSIANLFMLPLGMGLNALGYGDVSTHYSAMHALTANFIPVFAGNVVGGTLLLALTLPFRPRLVSLANPKETAMSTFADHLYVGDFMNKDPLIFAPNTSVFSMLHQFQQHPSPLALVTDADGTLLGSVYEQDVLRQLWALDFDHHSRLQASEIMHSMDLTLTPNHSLSEVIQQCCSNKEVLYPVSSAGYLLNSHAMEFEQRLRLAYQRLPDGFAVVDKGQLVGWVSRQHLIQLIGESLLPKARLIQQVA